MWGRHSPRSSRRISNGLWLDGSTSPAGAPVACACFGHSENGGYMTLRLHSNSSASLGFPGIPQHADGPRGVLGDDGLYGWGNGWAKIQPGELVHRHPLPAGEHRIARVEHRRGPLPYLCLKNEVDDVAVRGQALTDDHERPHAGVQAELFLELAAQSRVERLMALEPAPRQHPVALAALAVLHEQDLVLADDDRRHPQLRRHWVKGLHERRETDQRCAHRSAGSSSYSRGSCSVCPGVSSGVGSRLAWRIASTCGRGSPR